MRRPAVLVLDVNETLSDMIPLRTELAAVGAPEHLFDTWFASTLREGFGLTLSGAFATFHTVGRSVLVSLLSDEPQISAPGEAADQVLGAMMALSLHGDVAPALRRVRAVGVRIVTLTNGASSSSRGLLERGGVGDCVEQHLSIEDVGRWKPAPETYRYAAERCAVPPDQMMLAAVHPWDLAGARRAGLRTAWINRSGAQYPEHLPPPEASHTAFAELADALCED